MAALALRARREPLPESAEPNVIPFIDVLLVLLVIFMVTAPKPTTDLRLDLPQAGIVRPPVFIPPTIVELRAEPGGYGLYVSGNATNIDTVADDALAHILGAQPELTPEDAFIDARLHIRADMAVRYQDVVSVVERLQEARFQKVTVLAQRID
jgi:biopolymer transport protein ExbD